MKAADHSQRADAIGINRRTQALETIRRALGRLSVQTRIRRIEPGRLFQPPQLLFCSVRAGQRPTPGAWEESVSSPFVQVTRADAPRVTLAGGSAVPGSADSLFGGKVSRNLAALIAGAPARVGESLIDDPDVLISALIVPESTGKQVHTAEVKPYGGLAMAQPGFLISSKVEVGRLPVSRIALPKESEISRRASRRSQPSGLPGFASPQVASVPQAIAERIPLERRRVPMPPKNSLEWQAAFLQERQLLAHTAGAGVSFTDIELVGVYRQVPITAARRLEVEKDTNALLLYLRPQAALGSDSSQKPVATIAIGRVKSDGRLVRAVIRA